MQFKQLSIFLSAIFFVLSFPTSSQDSRPTAKAHNSSKPAEKSAVATPLGVKAMPVEEWKAKAAGDTKDKADKAFYDSLTAFVAVGTFLVLLAQTFVFGLQARRLRQTIDTMKEVTKTTVSVELPKIVLLNIELDQLSVSDLLGRLQTPRATVAMKNFGRSPAFILTTCADLWVGPLPHDPPYLNIITEPAEKIIEEGKPLELDKARTDPLMLAEETYLAIFEGRQLLWAFGFVRYRDFLNNPHEARFCKCMIVPKLTSEPVRWYDGPIEVPRAYRQSF